MSDPLLKSEIHAERNTGILATGYDSRIQTYITGQGTPFATGYAKNHILRDLNRKLYNYELSSYITDSYDAGFRPTTLTGILAAGGGGDAPDPPQDNLFAFYKANTNFTVDESNAVSSWGDDTSNGYDITQGVGDKQPVWSDSNVDGPNGYEYIAFDGSNDFLKSSVFTTQANGTYCLIVRRHTQHFGALIDGNTNSSQTLYFDGSTERRLRMYAGGYGPWTNLGPELNIWYCVIARFQSGSLARLVCRNLATDTETADALSNIGSPSFNAITVGTQGAGVAMPLDADIAEILVYNEASSDSKISDIMAYAQNKFVSS